MSSTVAVGSIGHNTSKYVQPTRVGGCIQWFKSIRFWVLRAFSTPVPLIPNSILIVGGRTIIEVVALILFAATALSGMWGSYQSAAEKFGGITIILGFRNNILSGVFGISFERALFFHKCCSLLFILLMILHANEFGMSTTGLVIIVPAGVAALVYLVKPYNFEIFYYVHIAAFCICVIGAFLHHNNVIIYVAGILWLIDLLFRYVFTSRKVSCTATLLPGEVVRLKFPECFRYEAGQYCFLNIQGVSMHEFHPFSLSSAPGESYTTFHIRSLGNWTKRLENLIKSQNGEMPLNVSIEGPYGSPSIDLFNGDYEVLQENIFSCVYSI